jgi:hypothetical protein
LLCVAYVKSYRSMFAFRANPRTLGVTHAPTARPAEAGR